MRKLLLATLLTTSSFVFADDQQLNVDQVVVSASRSNATLESMPQHTTIISQEQILNSAAQTVDQLLRNIPGLLIPGAPFFTADPTGQSITTRGIKSTTLVLVDGIPALDPFYETVQWYKIPLANIERIEIVRGGTTVWGNMAASGVINIITKIPSDSEGVVTASAGSRATYDGSASKNFVFSDALKLNIYAEGFTSNGYQTAPAQYLSTYYPGRGTSSANTQNVRFSLFFNPSADLKGFLKLGFDATNQDVGGYQYGNNDQRSPDIQAQFVKQFDKEDKLNFSLWSQWVNFNKQNGEGCHTTPYTSSTTSHGVTTYSYSYSCSSGATAAQPTNINSSVFQYATQTDNMHYKENGTSIVFSKDLNASLENFQLGFDYRRLAANEQLQLFNQPSGSSTSSISQTTLSNSLSAAELGLTPSNIKAYVNNSGEQDFYAIFAQTKYDLTQALQVSAGLRYDYYQNQNGSSTVYSQQGAYQSGGSAPDTSKAAFNPSLAARYDFNDSFDLRTSVYQTFRAPGLNNLYRSYTGSSTSVANPDLTPEKLIGREIGADYKGQNLTLGATLFADTVDNYIGTYTASTGTQVNGILPSAVANFCGSGTLGYNTTTCPGSVSFYTNDQNIFSHGLELEGKYRLSANASINGYYTYTDAHYTAVWASGATSSNPVGKQLTIVPHNVAGLDLNWEAIPKLSLDFNIRYNGSMVLAYASGVPSVTEGGYTVANFNAKYQVNKNTDCFLAVNNLFDKKYTDSTASYLYSESLALPLSATVGFRMRF